MTSGLCYANLIGDFFSASLENTFAVFDEMMQFFFSGIKTPKGNLISKL